MDECSSSVGAVRMLSALTLKVVSTAHVRKGLQGMDMNAQVMRWGGKGEGGGKG